MKKHHGFTLVEVILAITVLSILFGVSAIALMSGANSFSHTYTRGSNLIATRYALDRMVRELALAGDDPQTNIQNISNNKVTFVDEDGETVDFDLNGTTLTRDDEILLQDVTEFEVTGYDEDGDETNSAPQTRRIGLQLSTLPSGETVPLSLRTSIFIRSYMYDTFQ